MFSLTDRLNFGRYRGKTIKEIANSTPSYLEWCLKNVSWFKMDEKATQYVHDAAVAADGFFPSRINFYPDLDEHWEHDEMDNELWD